MHSLTAFGLGIFFALAGLGLFGMTLRKPRATVEPGKPVRAAQKRAEARELAERQAENNKLRIAAVISVLLGAALMVIS